MNTTHIAHLEPGNRIQLPSEWAQHLGSEGLAVLTLTEQGILVRPYNGSTWREVFATKLLVGNPKPGLPEEIEVTGDDLLF